MKKLLTTLLLVFVSIVAMAQSTAKSSVSGKVIESETGEALLRATVMIMSPDTTKMIKGSVTSQNGSFTVKDVADGNYVVKISYVGYHNFYRAITVKHTTVGSMNIGTAMLIPSSVELKAATVTAQIPEVEVKDDTLVFNADAFKVAEGSVLEDLVKKLPGAEVDENGTITINGKQIKRILVDGKEYFGNDQSMAMKNLPTEIIQKLKTYERKSDLARLTGVDDGNEETVLDLTIKKGMKNSWIGNVGGGYGTHDRYTARGQINRFQDNFQSNVVANFGNSNERGGGDGNTTNGQAGGRIMYNIPDKLEAGGNFRYNYRKSQSWTKTAAENYNTTKASFENSFNQRKNQSNSFSGDFKVEWKIDSLTTILLRPNFSFGNSSNDNSNINSTFKRDPYSFASVTDPLDDRQRPFIPDSVKVNDSESSNWSNGTNYNVNTNLTFVRRIKGNPWFGDSNPTGFNGRNFSARANFTVSGNGNKAYNHSNTIYHQRNDSTDLVFRLRDTPSYNRNYSVGFTYSEPILAILHAQVNYGYNYSKRHSDGNTYDFAEIDSIGALVWDYYEMNGELPKDWSLFRSDKLSRFSDNENMTNNFEFQLRLATTMFNITGGVQVENQTQKVHQIYMNRDLEGSRNFTRVSPTLNALVRFTRQHTLRATYRGNSQQPNLTDLFDIEDDSNALNIRRGNPNLTPSFRNNMSIDYNNYFQETRRSYNFRFNFANTLNNIETMQEYDENLGKTISTPVNIDEPDWNIGTNAGFGTPLGWEKLTANINGNYSYNHNVGYIYQNKQTLKNYVMSHRAGGRLTLTLRLNEIDVRANGGINWNKSHSDLVEKSNQSNYSFNYGLSSTGNFENGWGYSTEISVHSRRGLSSAAMNTNQIIWNAQVSYRFLKRRATVSLQAFDILNKRSNINRSVNANGRRDTETNGVYSYIMANFRYRFTVFGTREARKQLRQEQQEVRELRAEGNGERGERGNRGERGGERGNSNGSNRGGNFGGGNRGGFGGGGRF